MDLCRFHKEFVIVILFLAFQSTVSLDYEDDDDSPLWNRCPSIIRSQLKNGRVKLRSRGRIAKFVCDAGFELVGKRFATCVRGQWNNPLPVCVARGCHKMQEPVNGRVTRMYRGALLVYDCLPGYVLEGANTLYCDGRRWNGPPPTCRVATTDPKMSCDFEDPDLCGWTHDPTHDFDWKRNQFGTPSGHVGTGPSYDHTFGKGKGGFYLYEEASSPRKENDTSRIFSPVFPSQYSGGCFVFWYHMYGATTGGLRVYVKPESHMFDELAPTWQKFGDQGNQWIRGNISVPAFDENFQIIIEGLRGSSYVGDSAIDDVSINPTDCDTIYANNATEVLEEPVTDSCRGRCREEEDPGSCGCNENCYINDTCCSDYTKLCTTGNASTDGENPEEFLTVPTEDRQSTQNIHISVEVITDFTSSPKSTASSQRPLPSTANDHISSTPDATTMSANTPTSSPASISTNAVATVTISSSVTEKETTSDKIIVTPLSTEVISTQMTRRETTDRSTTKLVVTMKTTPMVTTSTTLNAYTKTTLPSTSVYTTKQPITTTSSTKLPITTRTEPPATTELPTTIPSTTSTTKLPIPLATEQSSTSTATPASTTATSQPISQFSTGDGSPIFIYTQRPFSTEETHKTYKLRPRTRVYTIGTAPPRSDSTLTDIKTNSGYDTTNSHTFKYTTIPSTSSTAETRKTYNLRPRTRVYTTSMSFPSSDFRKTTSATTTPNRQWTTSSSIPISTISTTTSTPSGIYRYTVAHTTNTSPPIEIPSRTRLPILSTRERPNSDTTRPTISTTRQWYIAPTSPSPKSTLRHISESITRTTRKMEDVAITSATSGSLRESEAHSAVEVRGSSTVVGASVSVVLLCSLAGAAYYVLHKRRKKQQSKLSDDSEMRFLSDNEFVEYSDPSALDKFLND